MKRLKEMKSTWDNEESHYRNSLNQMLENMKNLINEQEEKENRKTFARRLSAFDSSGSSQLQCDQFCFQSDESKGKIYMKSKDISDTSENNENAKKPEMMNTLSIKSSVNCQEVFSYLYF